MKHQSKLLPVLLSGFLLSACGGGSGGSSNGGGTSTPTEPPTTEPPTAEPPATEPPTTQPPVTSTPPAASGPHILFSANGDTNQGNELWITNGSETGTRLVKDINSAGDSNPYNFTQVGNNWFFVADDGTHGIELWITDGTDAGTRLVKDINPNAANAVPNHLIAFGNQLIFAANDGATGGELWISDGTEAGTQLVQDIMPGITGSGIKDTIAFNNRIYFTARDDSSLGHELWYTDGTAAGTDIADRTTGLVPGLNKHEGSIPDQLTVYGNALIMSANSRTRTSATDPLDIEPYSLGVGNTYSRIKDINPSVYGSFPLEYAVAGTALYILAADGNGYNIWGTDNLAKPLTKLTSFPSGKPAPTQLKAVGSRLYFVATQDTEGPELWAIDDINSAPRLVKDIQPGVHGSFIRNMNELDGKLIFVARNDSSTEDAIWVSDGTDAGTTEVSKISATGSDPDLKQFVVLGNNMLFSADNAVKGSEVWSTDGTTSGTSLVKDIFPDMTGSNPQFIKPVQGQPAP